MVVTITQVRMAPGGTTHEHITDYGWTNDADGKVGSSDKPTMVAWMDNEGGKAHCGSGVNRVEVGTVHPSIGQAYLRTFADGNWTNNLLSLPRF